MDFSVALSSVEQSKVEMQVDSINKTLGGVGKESLNKDDFLKILLTQLTHQDPTAPMEDKEFIAQMAQFSTLEQMTNMNTEFSRLAQMLAGNQAVSLLGKTVDIISGDTLVTGEVEEIAGSEFPQLLVNGKYYDYSQVEKIRR
jgi:flagellar basal-body rod modification protein FlgD